MIYYSVKKKKSPKDGTVKYYGVSTLRKSVSQKMIEEDYKPTTCITKFNVQFRPSVALRKAVQDTKVQKIELSNDVSNGSDVDPNA